MQWRLAGVMNKASVSVLSLECVFKSGWGGAEGSCLSAARVGVRNVVGLMALRLFLIPSAFTVTGGAGPRPGGKKCMWRKRDSSLGMHALVWAAASDHIFCTPPAADHRLHYCFLLVTGPKRQENPAVTPNALDDWKHCSVPTAA